MHWQVGIDEAGYGPTLGPFIMALSAVGFPERLPAEESCWSVLSPWIRSHFGLRGKEDNRLIVGDSKKIKVMSRGQWLLGSPWRTLFDPQMPETISINDYLERVECIGAKELKQEFWWNGNEPIVLGKAQVELHSSGNFLPKFRARVLAQTVESFNHTCRHSASKGAVTARAWKLLVGSFLDSVEAGDTVDILTDKQGGRNQYSGMVVDALDGGIEIVTEREAPLESVYRISGNPIEILFRFMPRAETESPAVAIASMIAKHLRDELMKIFNQWWGNIIQNLKPTAGYPGDALRFVDIIRPVAKQMGIPMNLIVRER